MNQIDEIINWLFSNDAKELRRLCNKEIVKFGGVSNMDYDDFYSRVGLDITLAKDSYNPKTEKTFKEYIYGVIKLSVWKEMKHRNRAKRQIIVEVEEKDLNGEIKKRKEYVNSVSLDAPVGDDENHTLGELIASNVNIERDILENIDELSDEKVERYLNSLSKITRKIVTMKMQDVEVQNIKRELNITDRQYSDYMKDAIKYEHIRLLHI